VVQAAQRDEIDVDLDDFDRDAGAVAHMRGANAVDERVRGTPIDAVGGRNEEPDADRAGAEARAFARRDAATLDLGRACLALRERRECGHGQRCAADHRTQQRTPGEGRERRRVGHLRRDSMSGPTGGVEPGSLYVVATPIGHLSDIGGRAAEVLRAVDVVAAEDTRTTRVLLEHLGAHPRTIAAHRHNEREAAQRIVAALAEGRSVALVSDAGTPAVSDPGARIVDDVRAAGHRVVPIPGPRAPIALIAASGLGEGPFHFEGFLPARAKARDERLAALARLPHPSVLFEAPHRIGATLAAIARLCGPGRRIAIGRELTKRFEEIHVCAAADALEWLDADPNRSRGE